MRKLLFSLLILSAAVMQSCLRAEDVTVLSVTGLDFKKMSNTTLMLSVENNSARNIKVKELKVNVMIQGRNFAEIMLKESLVIPKKSVSEIPVPLAVKVSDPLAAMALGLDPKSALPKLTVTGHLKAKAGMASKNFRIPETPVQEIMAKFAPDALNKIK